MPQNITTHVEALVEAAEREIETLPASEALALMCVTTWCSSTCVTFASSTARAACPARSIARAACSSSGSTPQSKYHKPVFGEDKRFVFFCAAGQRSALATQTAQRMGLTPVAHIAGGFGAWKAAGGPVEPPPDAKPKP